MANSVRAAKQVFDKALRAERDGLVSLHHRGPAPPAQEPAEQPPRRRRAKAATTARVVDEAPGPEEPGKIEEPAAPEPEPEDTQLDEAARRLIEAKRAENDTMLNRLGRNVLIGTAGVAGAMAARSWWVACHRVGKDCFLPDPGVARAQVLAPVAALAVAGLLVLFFRGSGGVRSYLIGADGRFSTSATQALMWTVAIAYVLGFLVIANAWSPRAATGEGSETVIGQPVTPPAPEPKPGPFEHLDIPYLLLLGGPFAAAGLARSSTARKIEEGVVQKVDSPEAKPFDVLTSDDGQASLVDLQFFVFNLVALAYFIGRFAADSSALPEMPLELVGLTSLAALTYTGTKIAERNAPVITSVTRKGTAGPVRAGDKVVVNGANFLPPGAGKPEHLVALRVRFGERDVRVLSDPATKESPVTSSRLVVTVPSDTAAGTIEVSVVTAAGLESDRHALEVAEDKPVVTAVAPLPIVPGGTHEIRGRFFVPTEFTDKPSVTFDGVPVPVTRYDGKHATVKAPSTLTPGGKTKIAVRAAAALVVSDEVEVPVKPK